MLNYLKWVPKNTLSYGVGRLVRLNLPSGVNFMVKKAFTQTFQIDMTEAEKGLSEYQNLEELFIRRLKPNSRRMSSPFCSPCDGTLSISQAIDGSTGIQAKEKTFSINELIYGYKEKKETDWQPAWQMTFYLAPHNYHRVHFPFSCQLEHIQYIPGKLYPVNQAFTKIIPQLYCVNERMVFKLRHVESGGVAFLVMVGALNVGRIVASDWNHMHSNPKKALRVPSKKTLQPAINKKCGDELGVFMLGSTVVLIFDKVMTKQNKFITCENSQKIFLGNSIIEPSNV